MRFFFLLPALIISLLFFSCSDSDDNGGTGPTGGAGPELTESDPANGSADVPIDQHELRMVFNMDIKKDKGSVRVFNSDNDDIFETINVEDCYIVEKKVLHIPLSKLFEWGAEYYVLVDEGIVRDMTADEYTYLGITEKDKWRFTIEDKPEEFIKIEFHLSQGDSLKFKSTNVIFNTQKYEGKIYQSIQTEFINDNITYGFILLFLKDDQNNQKKLLHTSNLTIIDGQNTTAYLCEEGNITFTTSNEKFITGDFEFKGKEGNGSGTIEGTGSFNILFE